MEELLEMEQFAADDEAEFEYDWLTREKLQFKILALIAVLANSHLAYRGTLADIREFLGISGCDSKTNKQIKAAIAALETDGLLK